MDKQEHKERHVMLQKYLDEIVADFINHTEALPSQTSVLELMFWAAAEAKEPTEKDTDQPLSRPLSRPFSR